MEALQGQVRASAYLSEKVKAFEPLLEQAEQAQAYLGATQNQSVYEPLQLR